MAVGSGKRQPRRAGLARRDHRRECEGRNEARLETLWHPLGFPSLVTGCNSTGTLRFAAHRTLWTISPGSESRISMRRPFCKAGAEASTDTTLQIPRALTAN